MYEADVYNFLENNEFDEKPAVSDVTQVVEESPVEDSQVEEPPQSAVIANESTDTGQVTEPLEKELPPESTPEAVKEQNAQKDQSSSRAPSMPARQPFRQKFQRWPNQPPRWNPALQQHQQQNPYQRSQGPVMRPPAHMMQSGPNGGPPRQMRPGFLPQNRPAFCNNNFMQQSRPPIRPPMPRQRFFYPGPGQGIPMIQGNPSYVASPIAGQGPALPRKVLINPNFKGGVEAAKSKFASNSLVNCHDLFFIVDQLLKDQFFSSSSMLPEDELLRKQQEFINHNMRQIEKRRHERTPSPEYRRGYSRSPSPSRYRRRPFRNYGRRRDSAGDDGKVKDENQPEEDEETRAYRQQIESQRKKREEILRQKEMRRRQQAEKAKESQPAEPLAEVVVTEKKIVLKRKSPERSMTPPITPTRRIVLKPSKDGKADGVVKPLLTDGSKRKIQKILSS